MQLSDNLLNKIISEIRFDFSGDKFAPKGKAKIPRVFYLGKDVIEKINNYGLKTSGQRHIKLLSKGKKIYMYVSPLFYTAIKGVERGRSSYEKEWRKPELTKLITDLIPGVVRGKMKKLVSPKVDTMLKMHSINFPFIVSNKNQTGYWVPAFAPDDKDIDTISTGLYENKMKKSELRSIIREAYSEFQRDAKGSKGVTAKKKGEEEVYGAGVDKGEALEKQKLAGLQEVMEGGVNYDSDVASELSMIIGDLKKITPYVLELGDTIQSNSTGNVMVYDGKKLVKKFKDVDEFLSGIRYKREKISEVMIGGESVDPNVVSALITIVPTLVALGAAINWKEELRAWAKQMKAKYAK